MRKYISALVGALLFVGLIVLASNIDSIDPEVELFKNFIFNSSDDNSSNSTNSSYSSNNQSVYNPDPIYGRSNLTVQLPSQNISWGSNLSIFVYNSTFYGNSSGQDFSGRIITTFDVQAIMNNSWYSYFIASYNESIIYDIYNSASCSEYYNNSLLSGSVDLRDILFNYYWNVANPLIAQAVNNNGSSNSSNATQYIPSAYVTGYNLSYWYNTSWWVYNNYTSVGYWMDIYSANFTGNKGTWEVNGTIRVTLDVYGNNSYTPSYNQSQTTEYRVGATVEIFGNWIKSITFDRQLAIFPSDLRNFLRAWINYQAIPYLMNNSTNTTGIVFPTYNISGFHLNSWIGRENAYPNYTWPGYYVYVYDFNSDNLQKNGNDVYGLVHLSLVAFGNDSSYPCSWRDYCPMSTVYSNATIYVNGVQSNYSLPDLFVDYNLRVNYSDIQNFLRGYFYAVMVPNITNYYNLTTNTTNQTIYLPNYYNNSQYNIDCSQKSWYCSGAHSQSYISFLGAVGSNLSITVDGRGYGRFYGALSFPYTANLINFTSTYEGKETIVDSLQGNATVYATGYVTPSANGTTYDVSVNRYRSYSEVVFDRNNFVKNAVDTFYSNDWYYLELQNYVNSILGGNTTTRF